MKIISLNANGLSDFNKFKRIITKLSPLSPDIILLQEIFSYGITPENQIQNQDMDLHMER